MVTQADMDSMMGKQLFVYSVVCYNSKEAKEAGWQYSEGCDVLILAKGETEAVNRAEELVSRKHYQVFRVQERF
jgi:hypothetical protein